MNLYIFGLLILWYFDILEVGLIIGNNLESKNDSDIDISFIDKDIVRVYMIHDKCIIKDYMINMT